MSHIMTGQNDVIVVGFDSAWTDRNLGAICAISFNKNGDQTFHPPEQVSFEDALNYITALAQSFSLCLVAIDQPTIVTNKTGSRPVDKIAASVISFIGGGVQPANLSKESMFGPEAPLWAFKSGLKAKDDPHTARLAREGRFLLEVFPALTLTAWDPAFARRLSAPKYNPGNRRRFRIEDWRAVHTCVDQIAMKLDLPEIAAWVRQSSLIERPRKPDQDKLDSVICLVAGLSWRACDPSASLLLGDLDTGFIVSPISPETRIRLENAKNRRMISAKPLSAEIS